MSAILLSIIKAVAPIVIAAYERAKATRTEPVTLEDLLAQIEQNGNEVIAEGEAWKASKGRT